MARIIDPDLFFLSSNPRGASPDGNIYFNFATKKIQAITSTDLATIDFGADDGSDKPIGVQPNPLDPTDGFSLNAFYSWLVEESQVNASLRRELEILFAIDLLSGQYQFLNDWTFEADIDRNLARTGGWDERTGTTTINRIYYNPVGIGTALASDLGYYALTEDRSVDGIDLNFGGLPDEPVRVDTSDRTYFKVAIRTWGRSYVESDLALINNTAGTGPFSDNHSLNVVTDVNITANQSDVGTLALYTGISLNYLVGSGFSPWFAGITYGANAVVQSTTTGRWFITATGGTAAGNDSDLAGGSDTGVTWTSFAGEREIGAVWRPFNIIFANGGTDATKETYYQRERWLRRQSTNINQNSAQTGTIIGRRAAELLSFTLGQPLLLPFGTATGVFIDDLSGVSINTVAFRDATGTLYKVPTQTPITGTLNDVARSDPDLKIDHYFEDAGGNTFPGSNAVLIDDVNGNDVIIQPFTGSVVYDPWTAGTVYAANTVVRNEATVEGTWYLTVAGGTAAGASLAADTGVTDWTVYLAPANYTFTFDFDNNNQGGRTPGTPFNFVARATGKTKAVEGTFTGSVTSAAGNVGIVMSAQRNYRNN